MTSDDAQEQDTITQHVDYWANVDYITETGMAQVADIITGWFGLIRAGIAQQDAD